MSDTQIKAEIQKLAQSALIELFVFDPTPIDESAPLYRFHAGTNQLKGDIIWQGNTYAAYPVQASGFDITASGQLPRPKVLVSNVFGVFFSIVSQYGDLVGAKFIRKRTFAKFLDGVNFVGGTNPSGLANPSECYADDVYFVEQKTRADRDAMEFELACVLDLEGVQLPRMMVTSSFCAHRYRKGLCGYTGAPVAKVDDTALGVTPVGFNPLSIPQYSAASSYTMGAVVWHLDPTRLFVAKSAVPAGQDPLNTTYWVEDRCGKRLASCKLRFGANGILNAGFFPGVNRLPA